MRYHYQRPFIFLSLYGEVYNCDHPVYSECTLFKDGEKGLAIIQQRFDETTKKTYWSSIDPWLTDAIYTNENFKEFLNNHAKTSDDGLYPTVTVRKIMWALRMKPIKKERWETVFDRQEV